MECAFVDLLIKYSAQADESLTGSGHFCDFGWFETAAGCSQR